MKYLKENIDSDTLAIKANNTTCQFLSFNNVSISYDEKVLVG